MGEGRKPQNVMPVEMAEEYGTFFSDPNQKRIRLRYK